MNSWVPPWVPFCWWFIPWELWGYWLVFLSSSFVRVVVLPLGLQTPSAHWVLSLAHSLRTMCSVQWMAGCEPLSQPAGQWTRTWWAHRREWGTRNWQQVKRSDQADNFFPQSLYNHRSRNEHGVGSLLLWVMLLFPGTGYGLHKQFNRKFRTIRGN